MSKYGFDLDGTLDDPRILQLAKDLQSAGHAVYVISAGHLDAPTDQEKADKLAGFGLDLQVRHTMITRLDEFRDALNEDKGDWSTSSRRQKFKSHRSPKVGDVYLVEDPKPGYYNYRKVMSIDGDTARVVITDSDGRKVGGEYHVDLKAVQSAMDKRDAERHGKDEDARLIYAKLEKAVRSKSLKGGDMDQDNVLAELESALVRCKRAMEEYQKESDSIPAGGFSGANSSTMSSTRSGFSMNISTNDVHRGGYWGSNTPYLIQIQVGGGQSHEFQRAALKVFNNILNKYFHITDIGKSGMSKSEGTNWSSVMITAPQKDNSYRSLPALNDMARRVMSH